MRNFFQILFIVFLLSFIHAMGIAQSCIPNNDTIAGIEPDTLSIAYVGTPYNQVIYFRLPADTIVDFVVGQDTIPVHVCIDSLTIDSVHGLPAGFSFSCNVPWCSVHGGGNGCASITGNPTEPQVGIYPIDVFVSVYTNDCYGFQLPVQIDTVSFYYIDIEQGLGMENVSVKDFSLGKSFPNPVSSVVSIPLYLRQQLPVQLSVLSLDGRICLQKTFSAKRGYQVNELDVSKLEEGAYLLVVEAGGTKLFSKIEIVKN